MRVRPAATALVAAVGGALLAPAVPFADEPPAPPVAALEAPAHTVQAGTATRLDSSASTAGAAPIVGHVWDLDGNGSFETDTGTEPAVDVKPEKAGALTVQVRVVDTGGQSSDAKLDLEVVAAPKMLADSPAALVSGNSGDKGESDGSRPAGATGDRQGEPGAPSPAGPAPDPAGAPSESPAPPTPSASPQPAAATPPGEPATAPHSPDPPSMSATPALVSRRALATRASAQGKTQPVAAVHAAAAGGVTIKDFKFGPASVTVNVGDTITWTNQDIAPHTATASDGSFDTGTIKQGKSGSHTFDKAGTFAYICSIHPSMKGTVTVAAASGSGSTGGGTGTGSGTSASPGSGSGSGGSDLPLTGLDVLTVVLFAALMTGSGALLRRRVG